MARDDRLDGDLRLALLTGAAGWRDRNASYSPAELAVTVVLLANLLAVLSVLLMSAALPADDAALAGAARWLAAVGATVTLLAGVAPTIAWPLGWRPQRTGPLPRDGGGAHRRRRGGRRLLDGPHRPPGLGGDLAVGRGGGLRGRADRLGAGPRPPRAGPVVAFPAFVHPPRGGAGVRGRHRPGPERLWPVVGVLVAFQVIAFTAGLTCAVVGALRRASADHDAKLSADVTAEAHGHLAYWLHNAVTTPLRHLRLQAQAGQVSLAQVADALDQQERELRRRQLDEELSTGSVQIAQLVQLQVRRAEDQGVRVVEVPRFGEAAPAIEGEAGRLLQRALDILVPNAIGAGARNLGFGIFTEGGGVVVEVEDDAGGFHLADVPAGRALDALQRDLGPGRVTVTPTEAGARVRVVVVEPQEAPAR